MKNNPEVYPSRRTKTNYFQSLNGSFYDAVMQGDVEREKSIIYKIAHYEGKTSSVPKESTEAHQYKELKR